ncbi:MAG: hypothetical protein C5B46_03955 [Proteobacteria bacterium]|nr:MAG: hypothetical protein C5B46_03955 [Pseudomonadota bacterium]
MELQQYSKSIVAGENPSTALHAARTGVAATASYLIARWFHSPEAYWAPISTMIVMQSTLGAALPISLQRFVGTAIGAAVGAVIVAFFGASWWVFGLAILVIGLVCAALHVERSAYRYAGITLAIVMLVPHATGARGIAIHRFLEVSLGILIGLILSAVWAEKLHVPPEARKS